MIRAIVPIAMGSVSLLLAFLVVRDIIFIPLMVVKTDLVSLPFSKPATVVMFAIAVMLLGIAYWKA